MPKVKIARKSTWVDMTAFVDVAFLILSFFMLATKFKPEEPVEVKTPSSVSSKALPEKDAVMISIDKDGGVYFQMDNPQMKQELIENLNTTRNLGLTPANVKAFVNAPSVGVPFNQLKQLLSMNPEEAKKVKQPGIPCADSTGGELYYWIRDALTVYSGRKVALLIKGDNSSKYPAFKNVLNAFKRNDQNKFQLVTSPEDAPVGTALYEKRQQQVGKSE